MILLDSLLVFLGLLSKCGNRHDLGCCTHDALQCCTAKAVEDRKFHLHKLWQGHSFLQVKCCIHMPLCICTVQPLLLKSSVSHLLMSSQFLCYGFFNKFAARALITPSRPKPQSKIACKYTHCHYSDTSLCNPCTLGSWFVSLPGISC